MSINATLVAIKSLKKLCEMIQEKWNQYDAAILKKNTSSEPINLSISEGAFHQEIKKLRREMTPLFHAFCQSQSSLYSADIGEKEMDRIHTIAAQTLERMTKLSAFLGTIDAHYHDRKIEMKL